MSGCGSTLASIIDCRPEDLTEFTLANQLSLTQFHAKFLGKSVEHDSQPPMPVEQSGLPIEGRHGDARMDVDSGEEKDLDDDVIEGCNFLETGIKGFPYQDLDTCRIHTDI
jgi:hypothetical protein